MKSLLSVKIRVVSKQKIKFLTFVFGCSKEPSHRDGTLSIHTICFGRDSNIGWVLKGPYHLDSSLSTNKICFG